jgi:hypothetical protein
VECGDRERASEAEVRNERQDKTRDKEDGRGATRRNLGLSTPFLSPQCKQFHQVKRSSWDSCQSDRRRRVGSSSVKRMVVFSQLWTLKVEPGVAFKRTKSTRSLQEVWYFLILWNVSPDLRHGGVSEKEGQRRVVRPFWSLATSWVASSASRSESDSCAPEKEDNEGESSHRISISISKKWDNPGQARPSFGIIDGSWALEDVNEDEVEGSFDFFSL